MYRSRLALLTYNSEIDCMDTNPSKEQTVDRLRAHRNLHSLKPGSSAKPWSFKMKGETKTNGADSLVLHNCEMKQPSGKAFENALAGGHRAVFCWIWGDSEGPQKPGYYTHQWVNDLDLWNTDPRLEELRFNVKKGDSFFHVVRDGEKVRIDRAQVIWLRRYGTPYVIVGDNLASEEN